jgi:DNA-binding response OmpR family regulator
MMKILLIEDDPEINHYITKGLTEAGYAVDSVMNGLEGRELALNQPYAAGIFDLMLPELDGLTLIEDLRRRQCHIPILILSAKREVDDRITGLKKGGDDYLTKPFSFSELLVRIEALIRRAGFAAPVQELSFGNINLNRLSREVVCDGEKIELQPREFSLLELFLRNPGIVLSKTVILEQVWNIQYDPQTNVVDVLVSRLRSRLEKNPGGRYIHTVRGVGYVLKTADPDIQ